MLFDRPLFVRIFGAIDKPQCNRRIHRPRRTTGATNWLFCQAREGAVGKVSPTEFRCAPSSIPPRHSKLPHPFPASRHSDGAIDAPFLAVLPPSYSLHRNSLTSNGAASSVVSSPPGGGDRKPSCPESLLDAAKKCGSMKTHEHVATDWSEELKTLGGGHKVSDIGRLSHYNLGPLTPCPHGDHAPSKQHQY